MENVKEKLHFFVIKILVVTGKFRNPIGKTNGSTFEQSDKAYLIYLMTTCEQLFGVYINEK